MPYTPQGTGWQGSDTSLSAAAYVEDTRKETAKSLRARILHFLRFSRKSFTSEELCDALDVDYRSLQPRLSELKNDGKIEDSGFRRTSSRNRQIIAWKATQ